MRGASVLFIAFLVGCGSSMNYPNATSPKYGLPLHVLLGDEQMFSQAADIAYETIQQRFATEIPKPGIVMEDTLDQGTLGCPRSENLTGCYSDDQILIIELPNPKNRIGFFTCNTIVHELGHFYFEKTEGNADGGHTRHKDFFDWAFSSCLQAYDDVAKGDSDE